MSTRARSILLALAVLLIALNLRPAVVGVSPLLTQIQADLGIGSAVAGLLTTLPVLCFGLLAPTSGTLIRRIGLETTLLAALVVLTAGILVRLVPSLATLLAGSVLAGVAIAVGNTLMPVVVKRDFPHRTGLMTGAYSTMLSGGGALAAAVMVPIENATGLGWRPALSLWAVLSGLAILLWLPWVRSSRRAGTAGTARSAAPVRGLWRSPLAWQVTLTMGLQSLQFYSFTAWAPTLFVDRGRSAAEAGLLLSLAGLCSLVTSAATPVLATRRPSQFHLVALLVGLWVVGYVGLLIAPGSLAPLWMVLVGLGQGVGISLGLTLITLRSPDAAHTSQLSGMAQGVGYVIAAAGPLGLGAIHDATGSWTWPVVALLVMLVPLTVAGLGAARDRHVGAPPAPEPEPEAVAAAARAVDTVPAGDGAPRLRGRVHARGEPVSGASVTLVDDAGRQLGRTETADDGSYALEVPGTSALLVCAAEGHEPVARRATAGRADVELAPRATDEPIAGR
ncbi:MFS transporter [Actinomycetospora termitidis]|uniref:MFS transporter n=1 Tax=Actinomycetospora termitidis TaxID=3053470 RepID=A0ABT7MAP6_9PSEU|nr:MFS transporter [Actinomycetospora sp. Odt1-22]MDL5157732.1 MFS transporter [Actinomycetospora sp. Odt1-22]